MTCVTCVTYDKKMPDISPMFESSQSLRSTLLSSSPTLLAANFRIAAIWRLDPRYVMVMAERSSDGDDDQRLVRVQRQEPSCKVKEAVEAPENMDERMV